MSTFMQDEQFRVENKRYAPRWNFHARCVHRTNEESTAYEDQIKDVSCVGACVETDQCLAINQKVDLKLFLSEMGVVRVCGTVVWTKAVNSHQRIGVHFFNTSSEAQETILQHAANANKELLTAHWFKGWKENK